MPKIISAFDLVAVQEVNNNMKPFLKMMEILGPTWSYIATDVSEGSGGNGERMAFVYDTGKVLFRNIAGEIVLPKKLLGGVDQFARTPFMVKFQRRSQKNARVFNYYNSVFREEDWKTYYDSSRIKTNGARRTKNATVISRKNGAPGRCPTICRSGRN